MSETWRRMGVEVEEHEMNRIELKGDAEFAGGKAMRVAT